MKSISNRNKLVILVTGVILVGLAVYVGYSSLNVPSNSNAQPTSQELNTIRVIDNGFCKAQFEYPVALTLKETDTNLFVITQSPDTTAYLANLSIDARGTGVYSDFESAKSRTKSNIQDAHEEVRTNGVLYTGTIPPGYRAGESIRRFLFDCNGKAIGIEHTSGQVSVDVFNSIIQSLKLQ